MQPIYLEYSYKITKKNHKNNQTHFTFQFISRMYKHKISLMQNSLPYLSIIIGWMNIFNNGSEQYIQNRQGHINVSGNHNRIYIRNSSITLSVNGNNNTFRIQNCNVHLQVNGNANKFINTHNNLTYGFNGNYNQVAFDPRSTFNCQYANGNNNITHNHRQQPTRNNHQQQRQRNRSSDRQNRQRAYRPHNQPQFQNTQQRRQQRQSPYNEEPGYPMQGNFMNGMPFMGLNFMEHMQNQLNQIFQAHHNRQPMQYQFRPHRNVFVFADDSQDEEEGRGLNKQLYDLLPTNKHKGKVSNCSICLDDISQGHDQTYLICFHAFHSACIKDWLDRNSKCPVCQYDIKQYFSK